MSTNGKHDNAASALAAVEDVWRRNAPLVERHRLRYVVGGVSRIGESWFIPLVSDDPAPDAYELARVINNLQEQIERSSSIEVTLALDPAA